MKEKNRFYTPAIIAFLTVSAYFFADTVDTVIGMTLLASTRSWTSEERYHGIMQPRRELKDYSDVLNRGLFGDGNKPAGGPAPVQPVKYTLVGTVEGKEFAGAVLADSTGQFFYRIKRLLPDGSSIIRVTRNKITLRSSDGATFEIESVDDTRIVPVRKSAASTVKKLEGGKFLVDQREVLASTENLSQILTQARAVPHMERGKIAGFRISHIVPNSIYAKIGLQNGDVIQQINSQPIDDPGKFFQLYQGLRTENNISIDLLRGGKRQTMNYEIR